MEKTKYYTGVEGNITVYNPQVKEGQTYAQIFVYNGADANYFNLVAAGWMVRLLLISYYPDIDLWYTSISLLRCKKKISDYISQFFIFNFEYYKIMGKFYNH